MATAFHLDTFAAAPPLERMDVVAKGIPAKALRELAADGAVTLADLARVVAPRRTLDRRLAAGERLSPDESDRFSRFLTVLDLAAALFGGRAEAMAWLGSAKRRFDGRTPLDLLRTDTGTRLVEDVLQQARYGFNA